MNKQIPYIFEDATFYRELAPINNLHNVGRTRIRAFYKGKNRNGSFINEEVAGILIKSAAKGNVPVIGFYNHETKDFERHWGPELAKGYGYIPEECNFAWEDYTDEDGVTRTYACFDCILFCDYFEEANQIIGKPQSMEFNRNTIVGDWRTFDDDDKEYFVYSYAEIKGFCVLGSNVEPCFESAAFFEKDSDSKFDKFSLLLSDLMERVKEAQKGGEQSMENEQITATEEVEQQTENFEEQPAEPAEIQTEEVIPEMVGKDQFDALQGEYNSLQEKFGELESKFNNLQNEYEQAKQALDESNARVDDLTSSLEETQTQFNEIKSKADSYEEQINKINMDKKEKLVSDYEKVLSEEEINEVKPHIADFSYDELESKLAVSYSRKNVGLAAKRIPTPEPEQTDFEKLISKYKK